MLFPPSSPLLSRMSPAAAPAPPGPEAPAEGVDDGGRGQHKTADGQRDPFVVHKSISFDLCKNSPVRRSITKQPANRTLIQFILSRIEMCAFADRFDLPSRGCIRPEFDFNPSQTAQAVTLLLQTMFPRDCSYQPRALATAPSRKSTMANDGNTMYRISCAAKLH